MDNKIKNPSFEGNNSDGAWTRDTHIGVEFGEIFVPKEWVAWWEEDGYRRPEMRVIHKSTDPVRVNTGDWAFLSFTFFGKQHAGLYQIVENLQPSVIYKLSAHAHAWSAHQGDLDVPGPHCSTGVGCGPVYIPENEVPELNGDPLNDAIGNFTFRVGVGSSPPDPFGENIGWGPGACIYNGYYQVPPIEFIAPTDGRVVIYLKACSLWEFRNSDAYWDDISLVATGGSPGECRGAPRVQYERTYVLLPPNAGEMWGHAVLNATWENKRYTLGGSADDAGIGDLDSRTILAINPDAWEDDLETFYKKFYPGVTYTEITAESPEDLEAILKGETSDNLLVCQRDPRWKDVKFGNSSCNLTIGQAGCFITCLAMAQRFFGIKKAATPLTVDNALGVEGYSGCRAIWRAFPEKLGLEIYGTSDQDAALAKGHICMAEVSPPSYEHFVLVTEKVGDRYRIYDPFRCEVGWLDESYPGTDSWRLIRPSAPVDARNRVGLHLQTMAQGWDNYVTTSNAPVHKVLASMQDVLGIKRANPNAIVIWRHVTNDYSDTLENPDPMTGARLINLGIAYLRFVES